MSLRLGDIAPDFTAQTTAGEAVLVIDDSITFRAALKAALTAAGYSVVTAESGETGLRVAGNLRPAAIIVDSAMPPSTCSQV